jgi:membrane protein insertase Oxa1/YidC/SpoIIIJ
MLILKIADAAFLIAFFMALYWTWNHQNEVRQKVLQNGGMPREASRGLVYGLIAILLAGFVMVNVYWLF